MPTSVRAPLAAMLGAMLATNDVFWLFGWLLIILIPVVWLARPPFGRPGAAVAVAE